MIVFFSGLDESRRTRFCNPTPSSCSNKGELASNIELQFPARIARFRRFRPSSDSPQRYESGTLRIAADRTIRDYKSRYLITLLEKFSDVVNWLKANASKGENSPADAGAFAGKKLLPEVTSQENNFFGEKTGSTPFSTATNFASSWSPGIISNSQNPFIFGNQSSAPSNHGTSDDADGENDVERPSSPSVKKSEEKGIVVVHEVKCKLYMKSSDPTDKDVWKDKGMGHLSIKCIEGVSKATRESKPTIVIRNEVGKILLNALLYPGIKTNLQKNSLVAIFHTQGNADGSGDKDSVVASTFLIRVKTEEDRNKLASIIQEYAPVS